MMPKISQCSSQGRDHKNRGASRPRTGLEDYITVCCAMLAAVVASADDVASIVD